MTMPILDPASGPASGPTSGVAPGSDPDFDALLAPVAGDDPAGASLRYDPLWAAIREARESDDATLPMGVWERPLVKADWKRVAALCTQALATRSKDFQLAAWLCEAWTHLHGIGGLSAGVRLMEALIARHWHDGWPRMDDGDTDARCAPFAWLNENLPMVLSLHVPLLLLGGDRPLRVTLVTWDRSLSEPHPDDEDSSARSYLTERATGTPSRNLSGPRLAELREAMARWAALDAAIDERLGMEAPSLARVAETLARMSRTVIALRGEETNMDMVGGDMVDGDMAGTDLDHTVTAAQEAASLTPAEMQSLLVAAPAGAGVSSGAPGTPVAMVVAQSRAPNPQGARHTMEVGVDDIADRAHAYRLLDAVAGYLARHEPHSPTPYLVRRAIRWGQMPLAELMRNMLREDGDVGRYFSLLEDQ